MTINVYVCDENAYTEKDARDLVKTNYYEDICEEFLAHQPASGIIEGLFYNDDFMIPTKESFEEYLNNRIEDILEEKFGVCYLEIDGYGED